MLFFCAVGERSGEDEEQLRSVERAAPGRVAPALRHVHGRRQRVHRASRPRAGAVPQSRAQRDVPTTCRKYQRLLIRIIDKEPKYNKVHQCQKCSGRKDSCGKQKGAFRKTCIRATLSVSSRMKMI